MKNKIITGIIGLLLAVVAWLGGGAVVGSVAGTEAYVATTTRSTSGSGTYSYPLCLGSGTFGSIVVVQPATAGYVKVWFATSTATTTYQTENPTSSTLTFGRPIAQVLSASDAVGTLTFDAVINKGLVIETASDFNGEYTITCKK